MKPKKRIVLLSVIALVLSFSSRAEANHLWNLLDRHVDNPSEFKELEIGNRIVYWHQRIICESKVEKDRIVFQFDRETQELLDVKMNWREDLPPFLPKLNIAKEQAELMIEGTVVASTLYIISPESDIFSPIKPTPENPCWAVYSIDGTKGFLLTVIDAVDGTVLGYGIGPPHTAFSLSGPKSEGPCANAWFDWYLNARERFDIMGYDTWWLQWPTEEQVRSHIGSDTIAMFYEIGHSGGESIRFASGCDGGFYEWTWADEVENWIAAYTKMPFTFLASCSGMCLTGNGTLSHAFRKGSMENTATVGYCGMWDVEACRDDCWPLSLDWQKAFFGYLEDADTVKEAFDKANWHYPECSNNQCMRFAGDEDLTVVNPRISRNCLPDCHDDYDEWLLVGRPECWCWPYQCDGDADGKTQGFQKYRVFTNDLEIVSDNWKKTIDDPTLNECADIDHRAQGYQKYRVMTNDLDILVANWKKTDAQLPGNCAECDRGEQAGGGAKLTIAELLRWLAEIWLDPEVREVMDEDAWLKLVESLKQYIENPVLDSQQ